MGAQLSRDSVFVAGRDQAATRLSTGGTESVAILGLDDGIYYELKGVGARIWQLLQEPTTIDGVVDTLVAEFEVDRSRCESDLFDLLRRMVERGLVEVRDASDP